MLDLFEVGTCGSVMGLVFRVPLIGLNSFLATALYNIPVLDRVVLDFLLNYVCINISVDSSRYLKKTRFRKKINVTPIVPFLM